MTKIKQLPTSVINKIAAGEVIERPASVVKELLENSVDAGATRIDVTVEKGGTELIRVTDNGYGIAADELLLAVASHATSKITNAEDLFHIDSLGFRGEALASIAEVSRFSLRSCAVGCEAGAELEIVGGKVQPVKPVGCPIGTSIEVHQLFFNTPVRQKFLRTTQTEFGHISEALTRIALGNPHVHFTLTHGGRIVQDLPAVDDIFQRINALFGEVIRDSLIPIESQGEKIILQGYVANPTQSRSNNRMQYLFLNGRHIRDRSLQHALGEAYRGLLLTGRFPICFLHLKMPSEAVDVNVHPSKLEVRFQNGGEIYSQLLGSLRNKFLTSDLVARGTIPQQATGSEQDEVAQSVPQSSELFQWAKNQLERDENTAFSQPTLSRGELSIHQVPAYNPHEKNESSTKQYEHVDRQFDQEEAQLSQPKVFTSALQIHDRYIVSENEEGLEIIDQHALHERILYEQIREKVLSDGIETQRLLVPEPVDLASSETSVVLENRELLAKLGLEVDSFGGETVLVVAYPAMLTKLSPAEVLRGIVDQLMNEGKRLEARDLLDELMHTIACKAAVKYGDSLTSEEVEALLSQRHLAQDHHHCPHGRPTALVFTREQLDRQFKRI